jgi:hypothetical protein
MEMGLGNHFGFLDACTEQKKIDSRMHICEK